MRVARWVALVFVAALFAVSAVLVRDGAAWGPGQGTGYALGVTGGSLMLALLLYPLRKRVRFMHGWAPLKHWFKFHMAAGILGPLAVLFHSTFHVGSLNAAVALACMLLVVSSGIVGRFLYRRIHHGMYGAHASRKELEQIMHRDLKALEPLLQSKPAVRAEVARFAALVTRLPQGRIGRAWHFVTLGLRRTLAQRRLRRSLAPQGSHAASPAELPALLHTIGETLQAVQRHAQFSTFERLFSLWHVIHIPFLWMMVITALVHVVAVHAY